MVNCPACGARMAYNDETTRVVEYACPRCHNTEREWKRRARSRRIH